MADTLRADARKANQIRPLSCELGLLNRADGSARFSQDKTSVVCGMYGPVEASMKEEVIDRASLQLTLTPAAGQSSSVHTYQETLIRQTLEPVVLTALLPRCALRIEIVRIDRGGALPRFVLCVCLFIERLMFNFSGSKFSMMTAVNWPLPSMPPVWHY